MHGLTRTLISLQAPLTSLPPPHPHIVANVTVRHYVRFVSNIFMCTYVCMPSWVSWATGKAVHCLAGEAAVAAESSKVLRSRGCICMFMMSLEHSKVPSWLSEKYANPKDTRRPAFWITGLLLHTQPLTS